MSRPRRRNQAAEEVTDDAEFWNIYPTNESYSSLVGSVCIKNLPL
jgi:hypothetical protein